MEVALDLCFETDMEQTTRQYQQQRSVRREARRQARPAIGSAVTDQAPSVAAAPAAESGPKPAVQPTAEDAEAAKRKTEWQQRFEHVSYSVLLSEQLVVSIRHSEAGYIAFPQAAGQPFVFVDEPTARAGIRLNRPSEKIEAESAPEHGYWVLQAADNSDSFVSLNNEGTLQRVSASPTSFEVELRADGQYLLLRNRDGHCVRLRDGRLVCDVPANALEQNPALLRSCLFEWLVRTAAEENDGNRAFIAGHRMTWQHPGKPLGMGSGLIADAQLSASSMNVTAPAEWSHTNAR
jgi:hypothetical protein